MSLWSRLKIILWALVWFLTILLFPLAWLSFGLLKKLRNLAYRKIVFIKLQKARADCLAGWSKDFQRTYPNWQAFAQDHCQNLYPED